MRGGLPTPRTPVSASARVLSTQPSACLLPPLTGKRKTHQREPAARPTGRGSLKTAMPPIPSAGSCPHFCRHAELRAWQHAARRACGVPSWEAGACRQACGPLPPPADGEHLVRGETPAVEHVRTRCCFSFSSCLTLCGPTRAAPRVDSFGDQTGLPSAKDTTPTARQTLADERMKAATNHRSWITTVSV